MQHLRVCHTRMLFAPACLSHLCVYHTRVFITRVCLSHLCVYHTCVFITPVCLSQLCVYHTCVFTTTVCLSHLCFLSQLCVCDSSVCESVVSEYLSQYQSCAGKQSSLVAIYDCPDCSLISTAHPARNILEYDGGILGIRAVESGAVGTSIL